MATVKHVVLDSGAFLRNAPVQDIGESLYTISDVVEEIRDKATKQRLQFLPYQLNFREPLSDAIKIVTEFAKKTGDYRSLSAVDIRVMALTYQLEKESVGTEHLKAQPDKKVEWNATPKPLEKAGDIAGFFLKPNTSKNSSRTTSECSSSVPVEEPQHRMEEVSESHVTDDATVSGTVVTEDFKQTDSKDSEMETLDSDCKGSEIEGGSSTKEENVESEKDVDTDNQGLSEPVEGEVIHADCLEEREDSDEDEEEEEEEEEDDDDDGWITPSNIKSVKEKMKDSEQIKKADVPVGCLTTDFAMQNVLIQMGLNVISVDGMLIKKVRSYVLRCFACMKITTNVQKQFCPHCGNKTLTKVSMTVNEDGTISYFLSKRKQFNTRGTKFALPQPKGGKHAMNPILVEDQPCPHNRAAKKTHDKIDVFNPDYVANTSPFTLNDVTSKAAMLGVSGRKNYWDRKNPNAVKKHYKRK